MDIMELGAMQQTKKASYAAMGFEAVREFNRMHDTVLLNTGSGLGAAQGGVGRGADTS